MLFDTAFERYCYFSRQICFFVKGNLDVPDRALCLRCEVSRDRNADILDELSELYDI